MLNNTKLRYKMVLNYLFLYTLRYTVPNLMSSCYFFSNLTYVDFGILLSKIRIKSTRPCSPSVMKGGRIDQVFGVLPSSFGVEQLFLCVI